MTVGGGARRGSRDDPGGRRVNRRGWMREEGRQRAGRRDWIRDSGWQGCCPPSGRKHFVNLKWETLRENAREKISERHRGNGPNSRMAGMEPRERGAVGIARTLSWPTGLLGAAGQTRSVSCSLPRKSRGETRKKCHTPLQGDEMELWRH